MLQVQTIWTFPVAMQCKIGSLQTFKLETTLYKGRVLGDDCKVKRPIQEIVGSSNEADVKVDGKKAKALVDTGSGISTIRNFTERIYNTESFNHYMTCCK